MTDSDHNPTLQAQRLCSEIQLFDLCDLETCRFKKGRFCSETDILAQFEKISEQEQRIPDRSHSEEFDDTDSDDEYDDEFEMDDVEVGEDDGWEE